MEALSISSDYRMLDYHVILAFKLPMIRADVVVSIKIMMSGSVAVLKTSPVRVGRTHLYGKYGGTLMVEIAQDKNSNIIPIAFALVVGENAESCSFFLSHLRQYVTSQSGILVISDRHKGIKAAFEAPDSGWLPPSAYQAFCIRHEATNFALNFKGKDAQRFLVNTTYVKTEVVFDYWFDIFQSEDPAMCDWDNWIEYEQCKEPSSFFVGEVTYGRLAELFVPKGREVEAQLEIEQQFSEHLMKAIEANSKASRCFTVSLYDMDNSVFTVVKTSPTGSFSLGSYRVSLRDQTYDCRYFQALHYTCRHALVCCAYSRLSWATYVHEVYCLSSVFNVYRMGFTPPIAESFWPPYDGPIVIANPTKRSASEGCPGRTRIQSIIDEVDPNRPKRCGLCKQPGHTRRRCQQGRVNMGYASASNA
ncbi:uncharacterized protein [Arachis hypogaea]|uniref:uncharacterized protein n=1 Tax=Arachis hypogaea TaxID=3818 RepID=UPI000DECF8C5|nr:uncharacterized protein LOC112757785 [Arachis hypogaea]